MTTAGRSAVLVDEHPVWLDGLEQLLQRMGITVSAKTSSVAAARQAIAEHRPDLLLGELFGFEEAAGTEWLRELLRDYEHLTVIVFSSSETPSRIAAVLEAGAGAYVLKRADLRDLMVAVRQAFEQSIFLRANWAPAPVLKASHESTMLTPRELEILALVAEGSSNKQVAKMLWVTEQTVKFHLSNVYGKLGLANRTEASRWAHRNGVIARQERAEDAAQPSGGGDAEESRTWTGMPTRQDKAASAHVSTDERPELVAGSDSTGLR